MAHVFISYKHDDGDFVIVLKQRLEEAGFVAWMDSDIAPGDDWRQDIDDAIRNAFALLVIMSPAARMSEYVTYEWAFATGSRVPVIPLMLQPTSLHPRLEALQHLDFTDIKQRPWDQLIAQIKRLSQGAHRTSPAALGKQRGTLPQTVMANLTASLRADDSKTRQVAAKTLGEMNDPAAIPALIAAADHLDEDTRDAAVQALGQMGDASTVNALLKALEDRHYCVRATAARCLGQLQENSAVDKLSLALRDKDKFVRAAAYKALSQIDSPEARNALQSWENQQK